jgi:hypothetical protein
VLGLLIDLEPSQAKLLEKICAGPLISEDELNTAGALAKPSKVKIKASKTEEPGLFGDEL